MNTTQQDKQQNPANPTRRRVTEETRIPMGLPEQQLSVPEIEGYVLHWFLDSPGRIPRAEAAGWEFVNQGEVRLLNHGFASNPGGDGNSDLGTRVSVYGGTSEAGSSQRLYLMKIKKEWYEADMQARNKQTNNILHALRGGKVGVEQESIGDADHRYSKMESSLFNKLKGS